MQSPMDLCFLGVVTPLDLLAAPPRGHSSYPGSCGVILVFIEGSTCPCILLRNVLQQKLSVQIVQRKQAYVVKKYRKISFSLIVEQIKSARLVGGIVALGKFDALHIGHRELVIQASKAGTPFLLSFVGIGDVLGWEPRPPIVPNCDRKRVLSSWAPYCGNEVPLEYSVQFSNVRHLTPRQFVERLSKELKVSGVVAGANYRFGYKASGDASELVRLCKEYGLSAFIVSPVMDKTQRSYNGAFKSINSNDKGQVSSTRVRHALAIGAMDYVAELIGRKHRLVLSLHKHCCSQKGISIPKSSLLNQPPKDDAYINCTLLIDDKLVGPANVVIDVENINIELNDASLRAEDLIHDHCFLGIEFG